MANEHSKADLHRFKEITADVLEGLSVQLDTRRWLRPSGKKAPITATNSGGWAAHLGSVRGDRGSQLQLWYDFWTRASKRTLAYSYGNTSSDRILEMAGSKIGGLTIATKLKNAYAVSEQFEGISSMEPALSDQLYGKPILETTDRTGFKNYLTVYDRDTPRTNQSSNRSLAKRAITFLVEAAISAGSARERARANLDYPAVKNRRKVQNHKSWERNASQAAIAKLRSGYRCCVCDMRFEDVYGPFAKEIAEAHHTAYVSRLREGAKIHIEDLITVCPNCHRVLHRMAGKPDDWKELRRRVRALQRTR